MSSSSGTSVFLKAAKRAEPQMAPVAFPHARDLQGVPAEAVSSFSDLPPSERIRDVCARLLVPYAQFRPQRVWTPACRLPVKRLL